MAFSSDGLSGVMGWSGTSGSSVPLLSSPQDDNDSAPANIIASMQL